MPNALLMVKNTTLVHKPNQAIESRSTAANMRKCKNLLWLLVTNWKLCIIWYHFWLLFCSDPSAPGRQQRWNADAKRVRRGWSVACRKAPHWHKSNCQFTCFACHMTLPKWFVAQPWNDTDIHRLWIGNAYLDRVLAQGVPVDSKVSWFPSLRHGRSADWGADRRVQGGLLFVRQGWWWNHHHERVGYRDAIFGSESDWSWTSGHDKWRNLVATNGGNFVWSRVGHTISKSLKTW